jgi:hypothetical protein
VEKILDDMVGTFRDDWRRGVIYKPILTFLFGSHSMEAEVGEMDKTGRKRSLTLLELFESRGPTGCGHDQSCDAGECDKAARKIPTQKNIRSFRETEVVWS